jgi:hypothetical protein
MKKIAKDIAFYAITILVAIISITLVIIARLGSPIDPM